VKHPACMITRAVAVVALLTITAPVAGDDDHEDSVPMCPNVDDENGRWQGSREIGGGFVLTCAPGFQVMGSNGSRSISMTCPPSLRWPEEVRCENIDDCMQLRQGCGAFGVCVDLVGAYDCNCEEGHHRSKSKDGEITCGEQDESVCGGHTCGPYGICVEFEVNGSISVESSYRCECGDGFFNDGRTCQRRNCTVLYDSVGTWSGGISFGEEYTLRCPEGYFVWGGYLQEVTITCPKTGTWLSHPVCISPELEALTEELETFEFWLYIMLAVLCVLCASLAAGLTLGLVTLEPFDLDVILGTKLEDCATEQERKELKVIQECVSKVLPLLQDHHRLLVTLLLFNTIANESLPMFLDELVPSFVAVLISVTVVLVCGEILPSAVFTGPMRFRIVAALVPLVHVLQALFYVIAKPVAMLLDHIISEEDSAGGGKYSRAQIRALLQYHARGDEHHVHGHEGRFGNLAVPATPASELHLLSPSADFDKPTAAKAVLSNSELRLLERMLDIRSLEMLRDGNSPLTTVGPYEIAGAQETAAAVVARGALRTRPMGILVLREDLGGSVVMPPCLSDLAGWMSTRDLLKGGHGKLKTLCMAPLVVPSTSTALQTLKLLSEKGASSGIVVENPADQAVIIGVVSVAEILSQAMRHEPVNNQATDCFRTESNISDSATEEPDFSPTVSMRRRRNRKETHRIRTSVQRLQKQVSRRFSQSSSP